MAIRKKVARKSDRNDLTPTEAAYVSGLSYEERPADCSRIEWLCLHEDMGVKLTPERRAWLNGLRQANI